VWNTAETQVPQFPQNCYTYSFHYTQVKAKRLQAWSGPEGSRK